MKPGSQRQKEYLKRLKEKNREGYLEKERKRKKEKLMLLKATDKQQHNEKIRKDQEKEVTKSNKKTTGMHALLWTC